MGRGGTKVLEALGVDAGLLDAGECEPAALRVPLADDPRRAGHVEVAGHQGCEVVLAQEHPGRQSEPGIDDQGRGHGGDDPAGQHAGQDTDR